MSEKDTRASRRFTEAAEDTPEGDIVFFWTKRVYEPFDRQRAAEDEREALIALLAERESALTAALEERDALRQTIKDGLALEGSGDSSTG